MPASPAIELIARQACLAMERTAPSSLEDDSDLSRDLLAFYPEARDKLLEAADWSFASKLAYLPPRPLAGGEAEDADLPHTYAIPPDAQKILEVGTGMEAWRRDALGIRADVAPPLRVRYTARSIAEAAWPAEFRSAVALELAVILAPKWLQTANKMQDIERRAENALKKAMRNLSRDASAARYDGLPEQGDWVTEARR